MDGRSRQDRSASVDDRRAPKRAKIYQACNFCQRRKTRCEGLTANGCARCMTLGKECSLAVRSSSSTVAGAYRESTSTEDVPSSDNTALISSMLSESQRKNDELQRKTDRMEERLRILEQVVQRAEDSSSQIGGGAEHVPIEDKEDQPRVTQQLLVIENPLLSEENNHYLIQILDFSELFFSITTDKACPHPVKQGIVSQSQADVAFQVFKHIFTRVLPLDCFISSSTSTPTHGFLLTCILIYVSRASTSIYDLFPKSVVARLNRLLEESLLYVLAGSTSDDVVLGLLVLSLSPSKEADKTMDEKPAEANPSATRLISMAFQIGMSGLAASCRSAAESTTDMKHPWMTKLMHRFQLWTAIVNRYFLLVTMHTRTSAYDWDTFDRAGRGFQRVLTANPDCEAFRHLHQERLLLDLIGPLLSKLSDLEGKMAIDVSDLLNISDMWQMIRAQLNDWRESIKGDLPTRFGLSADSRCVEFAIGLRLSCFSQRLPSPLSPEVRGTGVAKFGPSCLHTAEDSNRIILEEAAPEHLRLPEYVVILIAVGVLVQYRSAIFVLQNYNKLPDPATLERVEAIAEALLDAGGIAAVLCSKIRKMWKAVQEKHEINLQQRQSDAIAAPGLPDDFFNFELYNFNLGWDPSLVLYQDILGMSQPGDGGVYVG